MEVIYSIAATLGGGGIGTTSFNAVKGIFRHKALKKVLACGYNPETVDSKIIPLIKKTYGSAIERVPFIPQTLQWAAKDFFHDQIASKYLTKCDIFHGWNGHCLTSLKVAKKMGAVTIVERASSHPLTYERILREEYLRWGIKIEPIDPAVKSRLLKEIEFADYVTAPSDFAFQSHLENGVPWEKILKIPFGGTLPAKGVQGAPRYRNESQKFNAVFVGQVGIRKGVLGLLAAWKKLNLKDADLYLLGYEEEVAKKILNQFRGVPGVHFEGYKDPKPYYAKADVFIFPSLEEGSALVNYEAMSFGLPIITTFNSGSVIKDGEDGFLVQVGNTEALSEKIKYFYDRPSEARKMGENARKKIEYYSWERYGDNLVAAYGKVLGI